MLRAAFPDTLFVHLIRDGHAVLLYASPGPAATVSAGNSPLDSNPVAWRNGVAVALLPWNIILALCRDLDHRQLTPSNFRAGFFTTGDRFRGRLRQGLRPSLSGTAKADTGRQSEESPRSLPRTSSSVPPLTACACDN